MTTGLSDEQVDRASGNGATAHRHQQVHPRTGERSPWYLERHRDAPSLGRSNLEFDRAVLADLEREHDALPSAVSR